MSSQIPCLQMAMLLETDCQLAFQLPCINHSYNTCHFIGGSLCCAKDPCQKVMRFPGDPGTTYNVTATVQGLAESKSYNLGAPGTVTFCGGGTSSDSWLQIGGTVNPFDGFNTYAIDVSNPKETYFLNRGGHSGEASDLNILCYTFVVPIKGGACVRLRAKTVDDTEIRNFHNKSVPGITVPAQPFDGQFMQIGFDCSVALPDP